MDDAATPTLAGGLPLLERAARHALHYVAGADARPVAASATRAALAERAGAGRPLADVGEDPHGVVDALAGLGDAGTVASTSPRYFGFVIGGSLPVALAADWLVSAWDQNSGVNATNASERRVRNSAKKSASSATVETVDTRCTSLLIDCSACTE